MISIAISTYDANGKGDKLLQHNLDMIKKQKYKNFEVVISDHSKSDIIFNLVNSENNKDINIRYFSNEYNYGNSSANTNNAIDKCNGDLIKILFMDDYLHNENSLNEIVNIFSLPENKNKYWLANSYLHTRDYNHLFRKQVPTLKDHTFIINKIGCPSGITIRKEVAERFDENLKWYMDTEFYHRLLLNYKTPIFLHKVLVVNYLHDNQVSNTQINKKLIKFENDYIKKKYET
jgi:hypothetical protein